MTATAPWLDKVVATISPRWALKRQRARVALDALASYYDLGPGRRTQGWRRRSGDANAATQTDLVEARIHARDLVRNNPWAASAVETIVNHVVGWAIATEPEQETAGKLWRSWAETTACDADGRRNFAGIQKLVTRTVVTSGECLVRRRWRRLSDGLPIPMQLQVLEPDHLDTLKNVLLPGGGRIIQGVEFDAIGAPRNFWLFREHPGSTMGPFAGASVSVPAEDILHVFKASRPGQVRGISWFAPVTLRLKDFDEYEDAALMKQKIAACLAVITSDIDGTSPALGQASVNPSGGPELDLLQPGGIHNVTAGRSVTVVDPPAVSEHDAYSKTVLRAIAAGLGITYEDLTGDYTGLPYSAARMSRLRGWARVEDWRWDMLIPQLCDPVWAWAMQAAAIIEDVKAAPAEWTAPPAPFLEPDREGLAYQRLIRSHLMSHSEALRERGYRPKRVYDEIQKDNAEMDRRNFKSDADPRNTTQGGQLQGAAAGEASTATAALERAIKDIVRAELATATPRNGEEP